MNGETFVLILFVLSIIGAITTGITLIFFCEHPEELGRGPRCDICGEYLHKHGEHDCEKYC